MYARISAFLVACALVLTGLASAQERFGALTGRVTDQQGQPSRGSRSSRPTPRPARSGRL